MSSTRRRLEADVLFREAVDGTVAQQTDDAYLAYSGCHFRAGGAKSIRGHTGCPRESTVQGAHECRCKAPPSPKAGRWSLSLAQSQLSTLCAG
jgi:hypothetical protein